MPQLGFLVWSRGSDFTTKIVIISSSYGIPAQRIHIGMFHAWSMLNLETEILEHVDLTSSSPVCIRHRCQPLQWLVIRRKNEVGAM